MTGFLLSPGITPALTDLFVVEMPIALGLGYLVAGRRGFEGAFLANLFALAAVKFVTDYPDLADDAVTLAALASGIVWGIRLVGSTIRSRRARIGPRLLGAVAIALGIVKIVTDPYDPFDILLADAAIVAGVALWIARPLRGPGATPVVAPTGG